MSPAGEDLLRVALPLATPRALAFLQLQADPLFHRVPRVRHAALIDAALADGRALACAHREQGCTDPWALARQAGVPVRESRQDASFGTNVVCAEYRTRGQDVVLYLPVLERLQARSSTHAALLGRLDVRSALLAHELYHHFDCGRGQAGIARRHRVGLLRLGSWRWTSGVASLAEIAAGAFAQALLALPFHAKLLELLVVLDANPGAGARYVEALAAASLAVSQPAGVPA
jgi:hypothetical protein